MRHDQGRCLRSWARRGGALLTLAAGCAPSGPETAPNILTTPGIPQAPVTRPATGPWFVDRAREYGLDVTTRCGRPEKLSAIDSLGVGVALFDMDGDGDLDLFVAGGTAVNSGKVVRDDGPWLFRNDGPGRWVDVSARSGLRWNGWAQGPAVADYDGDGDLDLFVAQHGPDALWKNRGDGTFEDATASAGLREDPAKPEWGVSATWGDANGDRLPDLYVTNYLRLDPLRPDPMVDYLPREPVFAGPTLLPGEPDRLWGNRGDGTFEDGTRAAGLWSPDGKGMSALFADFDDDGRPDLYVTNDTQPNELFWNEGGGRFREGGLPSGVAVDAQGNPDGSMAVDVADLDGDGRLDLAFSNFRREGTRAYRNLGDRLFQQVSYDTRINVQTQSFVGWGLTLADLDDDGRPDLFQVNGHVYPSVPDAPYVQPAIALRNRGAEGFDDVAGAWGPGPAAALSGRALAWGDLDGDGDLDLVATTIDGPLRVLINEGRRVHHAAEVRLVGRAPDTEALGARVEIESGGRRQISVVRRGGSIFAAPDSSLHFGLGEANRVDRLTVRWPGGSTTMLRDLPADARILVREADGSVILRPFVSSSPTPENAPDHE